MQTSTLKQNPETGKSFLATIIAIILFFVAPPILGMIALVISSRLLVKAKKKNEDKKIRRIGNIVIYIPVLIWVANSIIWALTTLQKAQ